MNPAASLRPDAARGREQSEGASWGRWILASSLLHGILLAAATSILPGAGGATDERGPGAMSFEVSLLSAGEEDPAGISGTSDPVVPETAPTDPLREAAPLENAETESELDPELETGPAATDPEAPAGSGVGGGRSRSGEEALGGAETGGGPEAGEAPFRPPRLLAGALPIDPRDVEHLEVPAEIPVRILVGTDGRVQAIEPQVSGLPPPVLEAIRRSAEAMRFAPARRGNDPVEAWFTMSFVHRR